MVHVLLGEAKMVTFYLFETNSKAVERVAGVGGSVGALEEALRKEKDGAYAVFTADTMSSLTARRVERRNGDLLSEDLEIRFVPSEQS